MNKPVGVPSGWEEAIASHLYMFTKGKLRSARKYGLYKTIVWFCDSECYTADKHDWRVIE